MALEKSKLDVLDDLNEVRDSLGFVVYLLEGLHIPGFSPSACFLREVTRLVSQRSLQLEDVCRRIKEDFECV